MFNHECLCIANVAPELCDCGDCERTRPSPDFHHPNDPAAPEPFDYDADAAAQLDEMALPQWEQLFEHLCADTARLDAFLARALPLAKSDATLREWLLDVIAERTRAQNRKAWRGHVAY